MKRLILMLCVLAMTLTAAASLAKDIDQTTGLPPVAELRQTIPEFRNPNVLWDLTHGVYLQYEPAVGYSSLVNLLAGEGFTVSTTDQGLDNVDLTPYGIIVICLGSSWNSAYTASEVAAVVDFIDNGGGVFVMSDNTACPNGNVNPITQAMGTTCGVSYPSGTIVVTDFEPHPIFDGVSAMTLLAAGGLAGELPSVEIAFADTGDPVVTATVDCGMIVVGDINFCENPYLYETDNATVCVNIFSYLEDCGPTAIESKTWGEVKSLFR